MTSNINIDSCLVYRNPYLLAEGNLTQLSYTNPPATLLTKSSLMPKYYNTKGRFSFKLNNVFFHEESQDLEGNYIVNFLSDSSIILHLKNVTITLLNEVKCELEGYSEEYEISEQGAVIKQMVTSVTGDN